MSTPRRAIQRTIEQVEKTVAEVKVLQQNSRLTEERMTSERLGFLSLRLCALVVLGILGLILADIAFKGFGVVSWEFLTKPPTMGMTKGGILPALVGTAYVSFITVLFAVPVGMLAAIYLNEYARQGRLIRLVRLSIRNLSGVPSIVYGLFGLALFVEMMRFGTCILSSGLTLGLLTLPWTITASEEALKSVPKSYRDGALALGATRWQAIRTNVLPYAVPGMLTGTILGLARAAGETAPILFTGVAFYLPFLPKSVFQQFMALPYHLYIMSTQHHSIDAVRPLAYGTALVLVAFVLLLNLGAMLLRARLRRRAIQ